MSISINYENCDWDQSFPLLSAMEDTYSFKNKYNIEDEGVMRKISRAFSNFIGWICDMIKSLIKKIDSLRYKMTTKFNSMSKSAIVDTFSYVEIVKRADMLIESYYRILCELQILDHAINSSTSLMDDMKDKLKDSTIRSFKKQPTKRENYEDVIYHFQQAEEYKEQLENLLNYINNPKASTNPKKYSLEYVKKVTNTSLAKYKKDLEMLQRELEISKKNYDDRKWIYRKMHSEDIKRNQNILNHTANLIKIIEGFQIVYPKLIGDTSSVSEVIIE